jgi:hypothetical protein
MALQLTKTTESGIEVKNAYIRVDQLSLSGKENITFKVNSYKDKSLPAFEENFYGCSYNINGENPIKQAYLHLKTLPEFTDAVDC